MLSLAVGGGNALERLGVEPGEVVGSWRPEVAAGAQPSGGQRSSGRA